MSRKLFPKNEIVEILKIRIESDLIENMLIQYENLLSNHYLEDFEKMLVSSGKFVESFYQILDFLARGSTSSSPDFSKIRKRLSDSIAQTRLTHWTLLLCESLDLVSKFRNKRDGAHIADMNANKIDSLLVISVCQWTLAELLRLFSGYSIEKCGILVKKIIERPVPIIQRIENQIVILEKMSALQQILTLLYYSDFRRMEARELRTMVRDKSASTISSSLKKCEEEKYIVKIGNFFIITEKGEKFIRNSLQTLEFLK